MEKELDKEVRGCLQRMDKAVDRIESAVERIPRRLDMLLLGMFLGILGASAVFVTM